MMPSVLKFSARAGYGWVFIADVSHFVREGEALDQEAAIRGTSCYLVNRVIPMLPEALSNGLCSLVPDQDRYALSIFIDMDRNRKIEDVRLCESVIRSKKRLTYEQALSVLEDRFDPDEWDDDIVDLLLKCHALAQGLRSDRERGGALNLFSVGAKFALDVDGNPIEVEQDSGDVSHQLIEEFMLLANRCVAQWLAQWSRCGLPLSW